MTFIDRCLNYLRKLRLNKNVKFGDRVYIDKTSTFGFGIKVGNYSEIAQNTVTGNFVKIGKYASLSRIEIGERTHIESGVMCTGFGDGRITIGKECYIGIRNILDWSDNIFIGDYVHIAGPSTGIWTHTSYKQALEGNVLSDKKNRTTEPVIIEDNVYIGGNCTIYPGVVIKHHSVILPNSVINKNVEPYSMMGGVPARLIKFIKG